MDNVKRLGIIKAGNAGLVTTTVAAAGDTLHTLPVPLAAGQGTRTVILRKIIAFQNGGANQQLFFGTRDNLGAFVQLFPPLIAVNNIDTIWQERDLPAIEFVNDTSAGAAGRTGDICVIAGALLVPVAGTQIVIEVEEIGA